MLVTTGWLAANLNSPRIVILHVSRQKDHFEAGHIPGARFLGWGNLVAPRDGIPNELPPVEKLREIFEELGIGETSRIIIYGDNSGLSAARAWFTLDYLGHGHRASVLDGGIEKWKAEKREVTKESGRVASATFTPRLRTPIVVEYDAMRDISWVASNLSHPGISIIDARPEDQYLGNDDKRSGHIPGAKSLYWMNHLVSQENPVMKPASELRRMFEAAGVTRGLPVVTYCNSGVQASHSYFTARYLGYEVMMYDASLSEWGKKDEAPVAKGKSPK
jgi:thiosulfate/3-mercaptopyruvate sulfurtransferase